MWGHPDAIDERMVVSEIGEQWSPHTEPVRTQATAEYRIPRSDVPEPPRTAHVNGTTIGTLRESEWTIANVLDAADSGYAHACTGKWHVNDLSEGLLTPNTRGGWSHFAGGMWGRYPDYFNWPRVVNGVEKNTTVYATTQTTNQGDK